MLVWVLHHYMKHMPGSPFGHWQSAKLLIKEPEYMILNLQAYDFNLQA